MKHKLLFLVLILTLGLAPAALAKEKMSLYERFEGKTVKVYVAPVQDATANKVVDPEAVQANLEKALKDRKGIHFELVPNEADSDISVRAELNEYLWSDNDPIDMLMGVGGTAMDAAIVEDYARLQADFTITDTAKQKVLWKNRVMTTVTKKPMSQADSLPIVSEGLARTFLRDAFNRPKHRH